MRSSTWITRLAAASLALVLAAAAGAESDSLDQMVPASEEVAEVDVWAVDPTDLDTAASPDSEFGDAPSDAPESEEPYIPYTLLDDAESVDVSEPAATDGFGPAQTVEIAEPARSHGMPAMDDEGNRGHIHVVASGDTLWFISKNYLETPWVWPSIWEDNKKDIENPHLIYPGDRLWISPTEMRRVTEDEAEAMVAAWEPQPAPVEVAEFVEPAMPPAAPEPMPEPIVAPAAPVPTAPARTMRITGQGLFSFVAEEGMEAATAIVDSPSPRTWLSQGDTVYLGLGEGEVKVGDRFTVFRDADEVRDPMTNRLHGYHVEVLGWVQVQNVGPETAVGEIRVSGGEIERGDRLVRRGWFPPDVSLRSGPSDLEARVIYMPQNRTQMAQSDYVYLNRGTVHGVEIGSELEIFEYGSLAEDQVNATHVQTPDWRIAKLVVIMAESESAVAFIQSTAREIEIGDVVRSARKKLAQR